MPCSRLSLPVDAFLTLFGPLMPDIGLPPSPAPTHSCRPPHPAWAWHPVLGHCVPLSLLPVMDAYLVLFHLMDLGLNYSGREGEEEKEGDI